MALNERALARLDHLETVLERQYWLTTAEMAALLAEEAPAALASVPSPAVVGWRGGTCEKMQTTPDGYILWRLRPLDGPTDRALDPASRWHLMAEGVDRATCRHLAVGADATLQAAGCLGPVSATVAVLNAWAVWLNPRLPGLMARIGWPEAGRLGLSLTVQALDPATVSQLGPEGPEQGVWIACVLAGRGLWQLAGGSVAVNTTLGDVLVVAGPGPYAWQGLEPARLLMTWLSPVEPGA